MYSAKRTCGSPESDGCGGGSSVVDVVFCGGGGGGLRVEADRNMSCHGGVVVLGSEYGISSIFFFVYIISFL